MENPLLNRKEKLKREIEIAEELLQQNLEEVSFKNYLSIGSSVLPGLLTGLFTDSTIPFAKSKILNNDITTSNQKRPNVLQLFSIIINALRLLGKR